MCTSSICFTVLNILSHSPSLFGFHLWTSRVATHSQTNLPFDLSNHLLLVHGNPFSVSFSCPQNLPPYCKELLLCFCPSSSILDYPSPIPFVLRLLICHNTKFVGFATVLPQLSFSLPLVPPYV